VGEGAPPTVSPHLPTRPCLHPRGQRRSSGTAAARRRAIGATAGAPRRPLTRPSPLRGGTAAPQLTGWRAGAPRWVLPILPVRRDVRRPTPTVGRPTPPPPRPSMERLQPRARRGVGQMGAAPVAGIGRRKRRCQSGRWSRSAACVRSCAGTANGVRGTGRGVGGSMERPLSGAQLHSAGGCVPDPVNTMERCKKHHNSPFEVNQGSRGRQHRNMM